MLKEGCHVILLKNQLDDRNLVNGSRGIVIGFAPDFENDAVAYSAKIMNDGGHLTPAQYAEAIKDSRLFPVVEFDVGKRDRPAKVIRTIGIQEWKIEQAGKQVASRKQVPLKLAWAIRRAA